MTASRLGHYDVKELANNSNHSPETLRIQVYNGMDITFAIRWD